MATATKPSGTQPGAARDELDCPSCLGGNLSWLLSQAHFALASEINAAFEPLGLSNRAYHVLATAETGEYTQKELAELIGLDKTTMVVTLDELEEAGLAQRRPSKTDRRARVVAVTRTGRRRVQQGREVIDRIQREVLGALEAGERKALLESLGSLVRGPFAERQHCAPLRRREPKP